MDADPQRAVGAILEQIHIVIAAADGAELSARVGELLALPRHRTARDRVEYRMILDALVVLLPHAERDGAPDLIHRLRDVDVRGPDRGLHGAVAAADVVADAGRNHDPIRGHDPADRHGIALVVIGAQHTSARLAGRVETALELLQ